MKFTADPADVTAQESREFGRRLIAHPAESEPGMTGVSVVNYGDNQVAVVWLEKDSLVSWARAVAATFGESGPGAEMSAADVDVLITTAATLWDPDGDGADEALSERQREVLRKARLICDGPRP